MAGIDAIPAISYPDMQSERFAPGAPKAAGLFVGQSANLKNNQDFKMAHGGSRQGAGRKPGAPTKLNEAARKQAAEGGLMPLDYMLQILRDESLEQDARMDAAKAAAPYVHAKLASVEHGGKLQIEHMTKEQRDAAYDAVRRLEGG